MPKMYNKECAEGVDVEPRQLKSFEDAGWTTNTPKAKVKSESTTATATTRKPKSK